MSPSESSKNKTEDQIASRLDLGWLRTFSSRIQSKLSGREPFMLVIFRCTHIFQINRAQIRSIVRVLWRSCVLEVLGGIFEPSTRLADRCWRSHCGHAQPYSSDNSDPMRHWERCNLATFVFFQHRLYPVSWQSRSQLRLHGKH